MKDVLLNQIGPVVIAAVVGIIAVIIKSVGDVVIQLINKKKEEVEQQLELNKHEKEIRVAKEIWNIVEENFRLKDKIEELAKSKADEFDKLLLEKIPYLTKNEVNDIRQSIAGEINKSKAMLNTDDLRKQANDVVTENNKLKSENAELKNKLNAISNYIPAEQVENK
ncbi:cobalt ABC transporter permease [Clostridium perfringens]|uniref:cobalt ABC transporter permease n=1 Tax=Clostridium perfringens TaxID=1502 RepID=UPI0039E9FB9A